MKSLLQFFVEYIIFAVLFILLLFFTAAFRLFFWFYDQFIQDISKNPSQQHQTKKRSGKGNEYA